MRRRGRLAGDDWVGRKLRQVYNQAMDEPLSPELEELARRLAEQERGR